jgi:hypothetical protein
VADFRFLLVFTFCSVVACGGSASETPPPLEPDPHALPRPREAPKSESTAPQGERDEPLPLHDAPSTWGSGQKRPPLQRPHDGG